MELFNPSLTITPGLGTVANTVPRVSGSTIQNSDLYIDDYTSSIQSNVTLGTREVSFACTATASDDFINTSGHNFTDGQQVVFSALTGGSGLSAQSTRYFVRDAEAGVRFKVATTLGGAAVNITTDATAGTVVLLSSIVINTSFGGSFIFGPKPDGGITGGNARGIGAVDFQRIRSAATQVASGVNSVAFGVSNTASGSSAFVGGQGSGATGTAAFAMGVSCTASGARAVSLGQRAVASRNGTFAFSTGQFAASGDNQLLFTVMRAATTDATLTELLIDGTDRLTVPSGRVLSGIIDCTGVSAGGGSVARFRRMFTLKNVSGTTSLVGTVQVINTDQEDNASTNITVDADDTNDALRIRVTGISAESWRWVARIDWTELAWS
jgi:hypothetical protein